MLLTEAFEKYRQEVIVFRNMSKKTEQNNLYALRSFTKHLGEVRTSTLKFEDIRHWRDLASKTCSANTLREYILQLRVVLRHMESSLVPALDWRLIAVPKREANTITFLSPNEVQTLLDACACNRNKINSLRNCLIVAILYGSGLRVSEMCSLNRDTIKERRFTVVGKGSKIRACIIDQRTEELLKQYLDMRQDNNPALFVSFINNKRMDAGAVQEVFRHIRKRAGIEGVSPHSLRHSYATNLMSNGMHIYTLSRLMGHSSIQTTSQYLHYADRQLLEEYDKYHTI